MGNPKAKEELCRKRKRKDMKNNKATISAFKLMIYRIMIYYS